MTTVELNPVQLFFFVVGVISAYEFVQWIWALVHCDCDNSIKEFPFEGWFLFTPVLARTVEENTAATTNQSNYVFKPKYHLELVMWLAVGLSNAWNMTARIWDKHYDAKFPILLRQRRS